MIVVDKNDFVIGEGVSIDIVDAQGETDLIKVTVHENGPNNFFYIGTDDRAEYVIHDLSSPDSSKHWKYIDGEFVELVYDDFGNILN